MDRRKEIYQFGEKVLSDRLCANIEEIGTLYENNTFDNEMDDEFCCMLKKLYGKVIREQQSGKKGALRYLVISPLRSSIITGSYEFLIAAYSADMYLDNSECFEFWCPKKIYEYLEQDMQYFGKLANNEFVRLHNYEVDEFRTHYAVNYNGAAFFYFMEKMIRM